MEDCCRWRHWKKAPGLTIATEPVRRAPRVLRRRHQHGPVAAGALRVHRRPGSPGEDHRRAQGRVRPRCRPDPSLRCELRVAVTERPGLQHRPQLSARHRRHATPPLLQAHLRLRPAEHADAAFAPDHPRRSFDAHRRPQRASPRAEPSDRGPLRPTRTCPRVLSYFRIGASSSSPPASSGARARPEDRDESLRTWHPRRSCCRARRRGSTRRRTAAPGDRQRRD